MKTETTAKADFNEKYLAAVDLGSSKTALIVALVRGDTPHIVYYKEKPSEGIQSSQVFIPMKTAEVVREMVSDAEKELMIGIRQVAVGMPRSDVVQLSASAALQRENPNDYISLQEVETIKTKAVDTFPLTDPDKQAIYGAVAQSFTIEDDLQLTEKDVVGTLSATLEGNFKVFVGRKKPSDAIDKIFSELNLEVAKKYFLPEVTARAVLSREELKNGVALVDIGAGVTSISIYRGNIMRYYAAIPFGGKHVTADLEEECNLDEDLAEKIKKRFGSCLHDNLGELKDKVLQIRLMDPYVEITTKYIAEVVGARYREIADAILFHIAESGLKSHLRGGIVLTGGGSGQRGLETLIRSMSGYNVRKGRPRPQLDAPAGSDVFSLTSTSAVGMILAACQDRLPDCASASAPKKATVESAAAGEETPPAEVHLIEPEKFGEPVKPGTKKPSGERRKGEDRTIKEGDTKERTGVLPLVWKTIEKTALDIYDRWNQ